MLRSATAADTYQNVNLSNLKALTTTRHAQDLNDKIVKIDSVIREITLVSSTRQTKLGDEVPCPVVPDNVKDEVCECQPEPEADDRIGKHNEESTNDHKICKPVLFTIQYSDIRDIQSAVESFLTSFAEREQNEPDSNNQPHAQGNSCEHCSSTEIKQSTQIAEISMWRKTIMSQLNLPTKYYVQIRCK